MGVPGLFAWLRRKYPLIVDESAQASGKDARNDDDRVCHNLYIDMNHIIHACSHPRWRTSAYETEGEIFFNIQEYVERLIATCRPQRLLMIAIDGVAPQAKMCQQRTRRFMSSHAEQLRRRTELEVRREMLGQANNAIVIPRIVPFDGNIITPGTPFMAKLATHLQRYLEHKTATHPDWQHLQVVLSDANEPGEGEHKIMRFVRHQRSAPEYDPNTHHVIFGQDADLILLALLTHEPHFSILREAGSLEDFAKERGLDPKDLSAGKHQPLHFLEISTLREYLRFEFQDLVGPAPEPLEDPPAPPPDEWSARPQDPDSHLWNDAPQNGFGGTTASMPNTQTGDFDFERVLQDFILLTFLSGNDFLPNIPSLEIYGLPSGLDILLKTYKQQLPELGGPITNGVAIDFDRLKRMLTKLAEDEEDCFKRAAVRKARDSQRQAEKEQAGGPGGAGYEGPDGSGQWVSMGELDPSEDLDQALNSLAGDGHTETEVLDLYSATPDQLSQELARRVNKRVDDIPKGGADADPIRLGLPGHRARLYQIRFQATAGEGVEKMSKKVSHAYVQGLIWVLTYYVHGNSPIPITNAHTDAMTAAQDRLQGKGNSAADSSEGLGAAWDWYYPYHYAPLISDLAKNVTGGKKSKSIVAREAMSAKDDSWAPAHGPVRPLVQLMAVLPPESARFCLPRKLALIMEGSRSKNGLENTSMAAALGDMFPADLGPLIDMSGKVYAHTAVVRLPFANVQRLAAAAQEADPKEWRLVSEEEERNELRAGSLITNKSHPCTAAVDLIAQRGLSWPEAKHNLLARRHPRWHPGEGRYSLSVMRLLVPTRSPDALPIGDDQQAVTVSVSIDIAGVPTPPFTASLLSGCMLPPAIVTERVWEKEQSKKLRGFATSAMAGTGKWGGGSGSIKAGQGIPAGRGGKFAQQANKTPVLVVPRGIAVNKNAQSRTAAPLRPVQPSSRPVGQAQVKPAAAESGVPDWGNDDESQGPRKSDADVARELQNQFNSELKGPGHLSLDDSDEMLAKKLQIQADREHRRNFKPSRRAKQQLKADEDFALRMQRQEKELAKFTVLEYQEMLRRRKTKKAPDASEFPQLSESPGTEQPAKPVWPRVNKPVQRKQPAAAQGWGVAQASQGWGSASAAGSQSGSAQGSRASETWDDGPNWVPTYDKAADSGHAASRGNQAASSRQNGHNTAAATDGWEVTSNRSGYSEAASAQEHARGQQQRQQGSNNAIQAAGQHGNGYSQAQPQASSSMQDSHTQQQQPSRSAWDDYPQSSSNVSQQNHAQQSGRDNSFGNASGYGTPQDAHTGYKDASAATRQSARDDAERERRAEQERQRQYDIQTAAEYSRQRQQPEDAYPDYSQPYQAIPATPFQQHQSSHPMSNSSQALYQVQSAYPTQPTYPSRSQQQPQSDFQSQPHSQAAITAQYSTPYTSQPASRTPTAPGSSEPFSIDAWLTTAIGVPSAGPSVSQNQGSGAKSGYTSPQESKYLPPQRRSPPVTPGAQASSGAVKGPPGFGW